MRPMSIYYIYALYSLLPSKTINYWAQLDNPSGSSWTWKHDLLFSIPENFICIQSHSKLWIGRFRIRSGYFCVILCNTVITGPNNRWPGIIYENYHHCAGIRDALRYQIRSFFEHRSKGGGGHFHVQKFWRKFCMILKAFGNIKLT